MGSTQNTPSSFIKITLDDLLPSSAPTAYPIILHPFGHGLDLSCWTHALHSWFTWLFQDGENRHNSQPNFEAHQPPIPL